MSKFTGQACREFSLEVLEAHNSAICKFRYHHVAHILSRCARTVVFYVVAYQAGLTCHAPLLKPPGYQVLKCSQSI